MITGDHSIIYSTDADADRAFFKDLLNLPSVDTGGGWLIFGLPPSEVAVHPSETNGIHELYLLTDDVEEFVEQMEMRGVSIGPVRDEGWGLLTELTLPGGGKIGVYEPRHPRPDPAGFPRRPPRRAIRRSRWSTSCRTPPRRRSRASS